MPSLAALEQEEEEYAREAYQREIEKLEKENEHLKGELANALAYIETLLSEVAY